MLKNTSLNPVEVRESRLAFANNANNKGLIEVYNPGNRFGKPVYKEDHGGHNHDELIPDGLGSKISHNLKQTAKLPGYVIDGLKGGKDANFYEYMKVARIPYWVGGPVLVGCFAAGGLKARPLAKQKAAGVLFYYLGAMLAKAAIDAPVKFFKGVDLNRKYEDIVDLNDRNPDGTSKQKSELHDVYESYDFTRWDLLYNERSGRTWDPQYVNSEYESILNKMGLNKDLTDPDSTVKPYVKKIIAASRAWKYLLVAPLAGLALGLSTSKEWRTFGNNMGPDFKNALSTDGGAIGKIRALGRTSRNHFITPLKESFTQLWKGIPFETKLGPKSAKRLGKAAILAPIASIALANLHILKITYLKEDKYMDSLNQTFSDIRSKIPFIRGKV